MKIFRSVVGRTLSTLTSLSLVLASAGCSSSEDDAGGVRQAEVIRNYAANVAASYADTLETAETLDAALKAFAEEPSDETLEAAKKAWLAARDPYGLTEAYRFYQGPIDNDDGDDDIADGPEGLINSWPLDESYIDYVVDGEGKVVEGGIINDAENFPTIDAETLAEANTATSETSVSTGYHAIEFLLWGQDLSTEGPGERPFTDYVTGDDGTASNQDRRKQYLLAVSELLVSDLSEVNAAWLADEDNYRKAFETEPAKDALGKMLLGMGSLAGAELSHERMQVAFDNREQEDEHSCFSDNTLADLRNNATSVQNVLLGNYGDNDGPGVDDLVEAKDAALAKKLRDGIRTAIDEIDAVKGPFDQAILADDDSDERQHLLAAIDALNTFKEDLVEAAKILDIDLKIDE
jgi:putative iron-regulated protein